MMEGYYHWPAAARVIKFLNIQDIDKKNQVRGWLGNLEDDELRELCSPAMEDPEKLQLKLVEWRLRL